MGERKPLITGNPKLARRSDATVDLAAYSDAYDAGVAAERQRIRQLAIDKRAEYVDAGPCSCGWNQCPGVIKDAHAPFADLIGGDAERTAAATFTLVWRDERGTEICQSTPLAPGTLKIGIPLDAQSADLIGSTDG